MRLLKPMMMACLLAAAQANAAASRSTWIINQLYNFNHQFAATNNPDLATKPTKAD